MNMKKSTLILFLFLHFGFAFAQNLSPLELVEKVLTDKKFVKNKTNYASGEFLDYNNAKPTVKEFNKNTSKKYLLLSQTDSVAVVNVTITNESNNGFDCYYFLEKNESWKITAFRALAQTNIIFMALKELENISENEVDSFIIKSEIYKSKEDLFLQKENMILTIALDDTIVRFFKSHEKEYNDLLNEILTDSTINFDNSRFYTLTDYQINTYKKLLFSSISMSSFCENGIAFSIGGILDNTVGYLYIPEGEKVPIMNPDSLIMLRKISDHWYIYKTT